MMFARAAQEPGELKDPDAIRACDIACRTNCLGISIDRAGYVKGSENPVSRSHKTVGMTVTVVVISYDLASGVYSCWIRIDRPGRVERYERAVRFP